MTVETFVSTAVCANYVGFVFKEKDMFTERIKSLPASLLLAAAIVFCACENITSRDMGDIAGEIGESLTVGVTPGIDSLDTALAYVNGKKTVLDTRYTIIIPDGETTVTPLALTASDAVKTITLKPESASVTVKGGAAGRIFQIPYMVVIELGRGVTLSGIEKEGEPLIEAAGALVIGDGAEIIVSEWTEPPPLESKQPALTWGGPSFSALLDMGELGSSGSVLNVQVTGAVTMTGGRIGASNGDKDGAVKLLGRLAMSGKAWIDGGIYNAGQVSLSEAAVVSGAGIFFTPEASPIEVLGFLTPQYNAEAGSPAKTAKIVVADPQAGAVLSDGESAAALAVSDSKGETLELNEEGAVGIGNVKNIRAESETGKLTLRWDDPNYDGYAGVRIGAFLGNTALPGSPVIKVKGTLSHTFEGLTNGTEYTFKLQAFKSLLELSAAYTVKASPEKVFDSKDELETYLSTRSAAEGTLGNPVSLRVSYVSDSLSYSALLDLINTKQKYVRLDLGPSDFSGNNCKLEYVQAIGARELWIVSLKLPESVWEIKTGGTTPAQKLSIFGIKSNGSTKLGYWNMESIEMPGVKEIDYGAFASRPDDAQFNFQYSPVPDSLTSVSMPVVEKIGDFAFQGRDGLKHIYAPKLKDVSGFTGCQNLQSIEISPEAHTIGNRAFYNCERLTSILPGTNKITTIKYYAFYNCTSFNKFDFPSLTVLESNAFNYCKALVSVTLPETVTKIPASAFNTCLNLETVIAPGVETIGEAIGTGATGTGLVFASCSALKTVSMESLKTVTGSGVFQTCTALEEISFPVLENGGSAMFSGCTSLKSADLPELQTAESMFSGCTNLVSVNLQKLETIGTNMFYNVKNISSIALSNPTTLGYAAFDGCENLEAVYLPNIQNLIGQANHYLFRNCLKLNYIILGASVPAWKTAASADYNGNVNNMFLNTGGSLEGAGFIIYVANADAQTAFVQQITGKAGTPTNNGWFRGLATANNKDEGTTLIGANLGTQKFAGSTTAADGVKLYSDIPEDIKTLFDIKE